MTKLTDTIDARAAAFAREAEKAGRKLGRLISVLQERGVSKEAMLEQLADPNVLARLKAQSGWTAATDQVLNSFGRAVLGNMGVAGTVSESMMTGLVVQSQRAFLAASDQYFAQVMAELSRNVLAGTSPEFIGQAVADILKPHQLDALVNTTLNTYSRSVRAVMAEGEPDETLYVYSGPADERTRDICLEMMAAGELTKQEIQDRFGNAFIDGGGYSCRHRWIRITEAVEVDKEGAEALLGQAT